MTKRNQQTLDRRVPKPGQPTTGSSDTGRRRATTVRPVLDHERIWTTRIEAAWRDNEMPQPPDLSGLELLRRLGIEVEIESTSYAMTIVVGATDLMSACTGAYADWRLLVDIADLPSWEARAISTQEFRI